VRILIIDNNIDLDCWGSGYLAGFASGVPGAEVVVRRGPQGDLPRDLSRFDKLVLSGSKTSCLETHPWVESLERLTGEWIESGRPFLGVCYGHQILARTLGSRGHVRKGTAPEFGWTEIEQVQPSRLLNGLPSKFYSYSSHYEEVSLLPEGFRPLARSTRCALQAMQLGERPVFGIQFHPERSLEAGEEALKKRKNEGKLDGLLGLGKGPRLFEASVGKTIFQNFYSL